MATRNQIDLPLSGSTGTGAFVGANTPTLITPVLGAATGTSINLGASTTISSFIDDDTFATASATSGATSESIKAYVDAQVSGFTWADISGTSQTAAVNKGYVVSNASQTTVTLPVTAALGSEVQVQGKGAAGWILTAGTGQTIKLGGSTTSTAGTITSAAQYDCIRVVCITANTTWAVSFVLSAGVTVA